jgi:rhodanese-related sulfurtransferase
MGRFGEFIINHWFLFVVLAVVVVFLIIDIVQGFLRKAAGVSPSEVIRLINHENAVVLDLRTTSEYAHGHILGAVHIPLNELPDRLSELMQYKETPLVLCTHYGTTSGGAVPALNKAGLTKLFNLQEGIVAWQGANLPLSREN